MKKKGRRNSIFCLKRVRTVNRIMVCLDGSLRINRITSHSSQIFFQEESLIPHTLFFGDMLLKQNK